MASHRRQEKKILFENYRIFMKISAWGRRRRREELRGQFKKNRPKEI